MIKNANEIIEKGNDLIVNIISDFITLEKSGIVHKACCPFHDEKTPSFTVFPKTGTYKCFGCGQSGDAVQFLMDFKNLEFIEAVEMLSTFTRIAPEYSENRPEVLEAIKEKKNKRQELANALNYVFAIYQKNGLPWKPKKKRGEDYQIIKLDDREYKLETVDKFQIVYAGESFISKLNDENLDPDTLINAGIIRKNESGHKYDYFTNRILFPIFSHIGTLVGFGGRILKEFEDKKKRGKYLNSPNSEIYNKSEVLYGLYQNLRIIKGYDKAILVEGYTDVISLSDHNYPMAVATCGTSFTDQHAKLIKRFVKEIIIMRDGDKAGRAAIRNDIDTAVAAGLSVKVCFLPEGEDPDSFARKEGEQGIKKILDQSEDGIIWRIMEGWDAKDPFLQQGCYELAANLFSSIDNEMLVDSYLTTLAKDHMKITNAAKQLKSALQEKFDRDLMKGEKSISPEQANDVVRYGVYKQGNKYVRSSDPHNGTGVVISNFVLEPIMLIVAKEEQKRFMKVTNIRAQSFIIDMQSDVFVEFGTFKKVIEGQGDYLYNEWAEAKDHIRIKRMVYPKMPPCYPIYTMGWHSKGNFWTWANGITVNGKFKPVDKYGIVEHEKVKYFLPYFSELKSNIFSDDDEDGTEDQKNFAYTSYPECIGIHAWTDLMVKVHGKNAMVAISWLLAALFRDIIYKRLNSFPILNHFGPTRTGKSFLGWCLAYMFGGNPKKPFNINKGTNVAIGRTFSWVRNALAWLDEYGNDIPMDRLEFVKSTFDGVGREKGVGGFSHKTSRTPINSGGLLTGEHQPTKSASLFARCITLDFKKMDKTPEWQKAADTLNDVNVTGQLTQLTSMLLKFRDDVVEKFSTNYDDIRSEFREHFKKHGMDFNDQVLSNYCVILAVSKIIMDRLEFSFSFTDLKLFAVDRIYSQTSEMSNQDESAIFWKIISYLIDKQNPGLFHGIDILVEAPQYEKLKEGEFVWDKPHKLVYLNFSRSIEEYNQAHQKSRNKPGLAEGTIKYYLKNMDAYLGQKKSKRFGSKVLTCFVFDAEKLPIEFPLSFEENTEPETDSKA